jgi:DNA-binding NarL/FixJ family response regulator
VARAAGDAGALAYARMHQGYVALFCGELEVAGSRGSEGLSTAAAIPQGFGVNAAYWLLAEVALARGDDELARQHLTKLLELARAGGDEISLANALAGLAELAERRGEIDLALRGFADAVVVCQGAGDQGLAGFRLEQAAATAAAVGRTAAAVRLFAAADALHPMLEAASGRLSAGIPYRHEQVLQAARAALAEDSFTAQWTAGSALSPDEAIDEVRALAAELSDSATAFEAAVIARDLNARAALSPRERAVLQLMADGLADKAIAAALGISRRTASKHVAAVRAKLGAESRTAAVSLALRQGLL